MDFWLNDEQKMLRYNIREFAEKEIGPKAQELDEKEEFSYDITKKMAELGLFGIYVPEKFGGAGMDYLSYCPFITTGAINRRTNGCRGSARERSSHPSD
jgi:short/branched chain acyl-CoA dehydrogenase